MPNYQNGKIYKIECLTTNKIYIGSTTQPLSKRLTNHVSEYKRYLNGKVPYITAFDILKGNNYRIYLIEKYSCDTKEELLSKEGQYIRSLECVNKVIPCRTRKQYKEDNKEKMQEYHKHYYESNKKKINKYYKHYYESNKDKTEQYREANKDKIQAKKAEKINCECGSSVCRDNLSRHKRTKKRILFQTKCSMC